MSSDQNSTSDRQRQSSTQPDMRGNSSRKASAVLDEEEVLEPQYDSNGEQVSQTAQRPHGFRSVFKRNWWLIPALGVALVVGGVTVVRLRENASEEVTATQPAPLSVQTAIAQREPIQAWISSQGTVRAVEYQHLTFEVEGDVTYLAERNGRSLREGDRVSAGELLARVDERELLADVRQAEADIAEARQQQAAAAAEVAAAQAQVAQARSQVQQQQAQVRQAQANLGLVQTELQRYQQLFNEGVISASELDTRQNVVQDAEATLQTARAQVRSAQAQVSSAQAQVRSAQEQLEATQSGVTTAQAELSQAQVALEGATITAPFDGIIAYLNISEGEYFSPQIVTSQLGGDYQGILERIPMVIIDPSRFEVIVELADPSGDRVEPGQTALVASEPGASETASESLIANARATGEVFSVNPTISPGGRAVEARIRLYSETTERLQHGEQVTAWIAVAEELGAVVVPLNAVVRRNQQPYVFVVDPDTETVEQRPVELGITGITEQAIASGVEAGEVVVTEGQNRLVEGTPVQVVGEE